MKKYGVIKNSITGDLPVIVGRNPIDATRNYLETLDNRYEVYDSDIVITYISTRLEECRIAYGCGERFPAIMKEANFIMVDYETSEEYGIKIFNPTPRKPKSEAATKLKLLEAMQLRRTEFINAVYAGFEDEIKKTQTIFGSTIDLLLYAEVLTLEEYKKEMRYIYKYGRVE